MCTWTRMPLAVICTAMLAPLCTVAAQAAIIYVDADATGAGTGETWSDAFTALQDALAAAAPGCEIWVAAGSYKPDRGAGQTPGLRTSTFPLRTGVAVYGGFDGTESALEERDPAVNRTELSGDLLGDDQPNWVNHGENAYHVVSAAGADPTAILDGFTIQGGFAESSSGWNGAGGGMLLQAASPVLANCLFRENLAHLGGAIGAFPGSPQVSRCAFEGNYAWTGRGGGVYIESDGAPRFSDCRFVGNLSWGASSVGDGGAIFISSATTFRIERCVFLSNTSSAYGPPYSNGGAICNLGNGLTVLECAFFGNEAIEAGAVWTGRDATFVNTIFSGNTSLFAGGLEIFLANVSLINCDFSGNHADDGGGIAIGFNGSAAVRNCVLWGNTATNAPSLFKAQVHKGDESASATFRYSAVQGVFTPEPGEDPPDPANFPGCTEANPLFVDRDGADNQLGTEDDDLALSPGSPCVDAAENATVPPGTLTDLDGAPRFHDDPCMVDQGLGTPPIVDMGALEFPESSCPTAVRAPPEEDGGVPFTLSIIGPNPSQGGCRVAFRLPEGSEIEVAIHDVSGRRVRDLLHAHLGQGSHEVSWDGRDGRGDPVPAGLYLVRFSDGSVSRTRKLIVVR